MPLLTLCLVSGFAFAQAPSTDVLLVPLPSASDEVTSVAAEDITYLTDNDLYDNQPSFTPDSGAILSVSMDEAGATDIFRFDIASSESTRLTETPESEFSPTVTPNEQHIDAVRIEADGVTQRLWQFDLEGGNAEANPDDVYGVGYYAFADPETLMLVTVAETESGLPLSLQQVDATGEATVIAEDVGVGVVKVPGEDAVSFVKRLEDGSSMIQRYDVASGETSDLALTLPEVDAHAWLPDGTLIAAQDTTLYRWQDNDWQPYLEFEAAGVTGIGRLAVSPDSSQLAFVITKEQEQQEQEE